MIGMEESFLLEGRPLKPTHGFPVGFKEGAISASVVDVVRCKVSVTVELGLDASLWSLPLALLAVLVGPAIILSLNHCIFGGQS
jgi:hypothetical protein